MRFRLVESNEQGDHELLNKIKQDGINKIKAKMSAPIPDFELVWESNQPMKARGRLGVVDGTFQHDWSNNSYIIRLLPYEVWTEESLPQDKYDIYINYGCTLSKGELVKKLNANNFESALHSFVHEIGHMIHEEYFGNQNMGLVRSEEKHSTRDPLEKFAFAFEHYVLEDGKTNPKNIIKMKSLLDNIGNEEVNEEIIRHKSNCDSPSTNLSASQTKFFEDRYKYCAYPVYHVGTAVDEFSDNENGIWFASNSECTHGSESGKMISCVVGFNNPYEIDCNYFDFDSIPLDTNELKFFGLYKQEFGNKYDYIPDESVCYDGNDCIKEEVTDEIYTVSSEDIVQMIFAKGYDCAILKNINELFFHYPSDNTDYVVKSGNQIKSIDNLNPTNSHKFIEQLDKDSLDYTTIYDNMWTPDYESGWAAKYIFPDGRQLCCKYHQDLIDELNSNLITNFDTEDLYQFGIIRMTVDENEHFIALPDKITPEQFAFLKKYLEWEINGDVFDGIELQGHYYKYQKDNVDSDNTFNLNDLCRILLKYM